MNHFPNFSNEASGIEILIDSDVEDPLRTIGVTEHEIRAAVMSAASIGDCYQCEVGVRVTGDATIHAINRQFLQHDYPTDVISFPYELSPPRVEGELVVSLETAIAGAADAKWSARAELLLYVIHGTLHLVGFDDTNDAARSQMRSAETSALRLIGTHGHE